MRGLFQCVGQILLVGGLAIMLLAGTSSVLYAGTAPEPAAGCTGAVDPPYCSAGICPVNQTCTASGAICTCV